jgi:hypothetical protein
MSAGYDPNNVCLCAVCIRTRKLAQRARDERTQAEDINVRLRQTRLDHANRMAGLLSSGASLDQARAILGEPE